MPSVQVLLAVVIGVLLALLSGLMLLTRRANGDHYNVGTYEDSSVEDVRRLRLQVLAASVPSSRQRSRRSIDLPTLYINLDRSVARRRRLEAQLLEVGVQLFERVSAIDGAAILDGTATLRSEPWACRLPTAPEDLLRVINCQPGMHAIGAVVGCTLSHLKAISRAKALGAGPVLIMEDDADLVGECLWPFSLVELLDRAPAGWHVVCLYYPTMPMTSPQRAEFHTLDTQICQSAAAYVISPLGQEAVARALERPEQVIAKAALKDACVADQLVYRLMGDDNNIYFYSYPLIIPWNDHEEFESVIHPGHTDAHISRTAQALRMQLEGAQGSISPKD